MFYSALAFKKDWPRTHVWTAAFRVESKSVARSRYPAAHGGKRLPLLPSGPGGVHAAPSHKARFFNAPYLARPTTPRRNAGIQLC